MTVFTPPHREPVPQDALTLFLGGSIEMGAATDWQKYAISQLEPHFQALFNPRREDWDSSWEQSIDNPDFFGQVTWELDHIDSATHVLFHFEPGTMSPITLMELGLVARAGYPKLVFISCPEGFWRRGNVEIVAKRYGLSFRSSLDDAIKAIVETTQV